MKKLSLVVCIVLVFGVLAGCGGGQYGSNNDYTKIIEDARDPELNTISQFDVVSSPDSAMYDMVFGEGLWFDDSVMERYAISSSSILIQVYGVAIILPKEGQEQAVLDQINAYVEYQQRSQENYLPDQYEIAMNAIVKTAKTGEVLLAMCEDAETVMANMEAGLAA